MSSYICACMKGLFFALIACFAFSLSANAFTVVLDAGHGGKDPGALGSKGREKNITLAVVQAVGSKLNSEAKDIKVVYTRNSDVYITLQGRADIANASKADLFVSVHVNANNHNELYGTEVYTLGLHKSQSNLDVAMRENSVMTLESGYKDKYAGFDPGSVDSYIMFECLQDRYVDKSVALAKSIGDNFGSIGRKNRGVRQAGFWVLHKTAMPAVLVEIGYITNKEEQEFLITSEGQRKLADCIYDGIVEFKNEYDKKSGKQTFMLEDEIKPVETRREVGQRVVASMESQEAKNQRKEADAEQALYEEKEKRREEARQAAIEMSQKGVEKEQSEQKSNSVSSVEPVKPSRDEVEYRLQVMALNRRLPKNDLAMKGLDLNFYEEGGYVKYTYGSETNYSEIQKRKEEIRDKFPDAMIVKFRNGVKIK